MQVAVDTASRAVRQHGDSLGDLDGCEIVPLSDAQARSFLALLAQVEGDGYVAHAPDGTFDRVAASQDWQDAEAARQQARQQREADLALIRAHGTEHPDPVVQAAARLLAG